MMNHLFNYQSLISVIYNWKCQFINVTKNIFIYYLIMLKIYIFINQFELIFNRNKITNYRRKNKINKTI